MEQRHRGRVTGWWKDGKSTHSRPSQAQRCRSYKCEESISLFLAAARKHQQMAGFMLSRALPRGGLRVSTGASCLPGCFQGARTQSVHSGAPRGLAACVALSFVCSCDARMKRAHVTAGMYCDGELLSVHICSWRFGQKGTPEWKGAALRAGKPSGLLLLLAGVQAEVQGPRLGPAPRLSPLTSARRSIHHTPSPDI